MEFPFSFSWCIIQYICSLDDYICEDLSKELHQLLNKKSSKNPVYFWAKKTLNENKDNLEKTEIEYLNEFINHFE